jgi:carbon monoxide dehydrogenase subunit G
MSRRGVPVVVVPSTYVPLALAVKVPVTLNEPEIPTLVQVRGSSPSQDGSTLPFTVRHELQPANGGTRLMVTAEGDVPGLAAGLLARGAEKQFRKDFERLKKILES